MMTAHSSSPSALYQSWLPMSTHWRELVILTGAVILSIIISNLSRPGEQSLAQPPPRSQTSSTASATFPDASAYIITFGGFQPAWGKAYKYHPLKTTFIVEVGSILCGAAPNTDALIVGRAIADLGISTGGTTIIAFSARPERPPALLGLMGVTYSLATVAGTLLEGVFSDEVT
ncbi:hypothetical protein F5B18DRAFT_87478 [Nemania serpens]|nr:hypothetical protein F5B18DRAFT_87478 [Nemania serpens]